MTHKKSILSLAVGSAFAATLSVAPIASAADSPFVSQSLDRGYMVAGAHDHATKKAGEGKCGAMKTSEGSCGVTMADLNKDGKVSKEEFTKHHDVMFEHMDANKDGFIDKSEMGMGEMAKKKTDKSK
ncbi:MAG: hypothetical protein ITD31_07195 [Nitrosospira sp.]|jgi:uncharacterized low-complexity protein|nr:hypothetical protein [Nitrosospira sp.]MBP0133153.1 hypothetical protein [Nitrosospira sp.]